MLMLESALKESHITTKRLSKVSNKTANTLVNGLWEVKTRFWEKINAFKPSLKRMANICHIFIFSIP